jgi:hypothetical protein
MIPLQIPLLFNPILVPCAEFELQDMVKKRIPLFFLILNYFQSSWINVSENNETTAFSLTVSTPTVLESSPPRHLTWHDTWFPLGYNSYPPSVFVFQYSFWNHHRFSLVRYNPTVSILCVSFFQSFYYATFLAQIPFNVSSFQYG